MSRANRFKWGSQVRLPALAQVTSSPSYLLRTAVDIKALLREPGEGHQGKSQRVVERARDFIELARAGKNLLEREDAGLVADVQAIDAYTSAREALRQLQTTEDLLASCLEILNCLEIGQPLDEPARREAYRFFHSVARTMSQELSREEGVYASSRLNPA